MMKVDGSATLRFRLLVGAALAGMLVAPAGARTQQAGGESAAEGGEIVVTARKREEAAQDVPVSIYAASGKALAERGIGDVSQLAGNVVGVAIQDGGPGYRTLFIRGLGSDRGNAPTTGFYLDETFVAPGGAVQAVIEPLYFDVERVEVLRGPQGTVFGGGSMGGTVRVISKRPDSSAFGMAAGADLSITRDGGFNRQFSGMANIVLLPDVAALRVAGSHRHRDGYIDAIIAPGGFAGPDRIPVGPSTRVENVNDDQTFTLRAALALDLSDRLRVEPSVFHQKVRAGAFAAMDRPAETRDVRRVVPAPEWLRDEFRLANLLVTYDLGFAELLSSTSGSRRTAAYREDISDFVFQSFLAPFMTTPLTIGFEGGSKERLFSQEIRLASNGGGAFNYVLGGYYENYRRDSTSVARNPALQSGFPVALRPLINTMYPNGLLFERASGFQRKQWALFGEADYDLTERLNLALGARYYRFDMDSWIELPAYQAVSGRDDGVNPRATLSYKTGGDSGNMVYMTAARGFRPGGPNRLFDAVEYAACGAQYRAAGVGIDPTTRQVAPYGPDNVWSYELGAKTRLGSKVTLNGAVYAMNWNDIQQFFLPACGRGATQNFGKAHVRGIEIEWNARLGGGVSVMGGVNYSNAEIAADIPQLGVGKGAKVQNAPEWTGNATLQYDFAGPLGTKASAIANVRHTGSSFRDFNQTPASARRFQDAYTLLNARMNLTRNNWTWSVYANNITDAKPGAFNFLSSAGPVAGYERMVTIEPRTIGVALRINH